MKSLVCQIPTSSSLQPPGVIVLNRIPCWRDPRPWNSYLGHALQLTGSELIPGGLYPQVRLGVNPLLIAPVLKLPVTWIPALPAVAAQLKSSPRCFLFVSGCLKRNGHCWTWMLKVRIRTAQCRYAEQNSEDINLQHMNSSKNFGPSMKSTRGW